MKKNTAKYSLKAIKLSLTLILILFVRNIQAQIPVEVMLGHEQAQHEFFFFKDLDTNHRFNLFSMARFAVDYEDQSLNRSFVSSQLTYNLTKSWGISTGGMYDNGSFSPLAAISYFFMSKKRDLIINLFPTVHFQSTTNFEMFGLFFYTPRLTDNLNLFTQIIFGSNFDIRFDNHLFSYQQFRLGLGIKNWFQAGLALDQNFYGSEAEYQNNVGIFLRKEL